MKKMKHFIFLTAALFFFLGQSTEIYANKKGKDKILKSGHYRNRLLYVSNWTAKRWTSEVIKAAFKSQGVDIRFAVIKGSNAWGRVLKGVKKGTFVGGYPAYYS